MIDKSNLTISGVLDLLLDAVCMVDVEGRFVFVSAACESIFGFTPPEMVGRRMIDLVHPEDRDKTLQAASRIMSGQAQLHFENRSVRKDGQVVHIMWSARWSEADQLRIAVARDITLRKRAELLQASTYSISEAAHSADNLYDLFHHIHQTLKTLLPSPNLFIALRDLKTGHVTFPYAEDEDQLGVKRPDMALEYFCQEVIDLEQAVLRGHGGAAPRALQADAVPDGDFQTLLGIPLRSLNGTTGAMVLRSSRGTDPYTEQDKELLQYISTQIATVLERKQLFAQMQYLAQYDALTDLPNRELLQDRLKTAIGRARREQHQFTVLFLDLDKFKRINDTLGHALGDRLLHAFAARLKQSVRESDTVARVGGDEFVVVLESQQPRDDKLQVIQKIRSAFNEPFTLGAHTIHVRPSIGLANYPEHGADPQALLNFADSAMYLAKSSYREKTPGADLSS